MKKMMYILLITVFLMSEMFSYTVLASEKKESREDYETLLDNYIKKDHADLMMDDDKYSYCIFHEDVTGNSWDSLKLRLGVGFTDLISDTKSKPDKDKYMEVLMTMLATYDQDNAEKVYSQSKNDDLKTIENYVADSAELITDSIDVWGGNIPLLPEFDPETSSFMDAMSVLINSSDTALDNLRFYKTLVQNYVKYNSILEVIENEAEGDLKEAAKDLRVVMASAMECTNMAIEEGRTDVLSDMGEFFLTNKMAKILKESKYYVKGSPVVKFVEIWEKGLPVYKIAKFIKEVGLLSANVAIGYENLVNRYAEVTALVEIDEILKKQIDDNKNAYVSVKKKDEKREHAEKMMEYSELLLGNRIRGEYCTYSICANDAGGIGKLMKNQMKGEPFEEYYKRKTDIILELNSDIQSINKALDGYTNLESEGYTGPVETNIRWKDMFVYVNEVEVIEYTVIGPTGKCYWSSDDPSVVSVDSSGTIRGIKAGTATVTLKANDLTDTIKIDVLEPELDAEDIILSEGDTERINYTVSGPDTTVYFTCSDNSIAAVDEFGMVTAIKAGSAVITLEANNVKTDIEVIVESAAAERELTMEGIRLPYGSYEGIKPQGDGAIPVELDLNQDGTFRLYCLFDLFSEEDCTEHTYTGTFAIDRFNENGDAVLLFMSSAMDFEMVWNGKTLDHENFFIWVND